MIDLLDLLMPKSAGRSPARDGLSYIDLQFQVAVVQIAHVSDCAGQVFS